MGFSLALRNARKTHSYVTTDSKVYFTTNIPDSAQTSVTPLRLRKVMDLAPITVKLYLLTITKFTNFKVLEHTPMEQIVDLFRKLGLRQLLVSRDGKLLGIITKKDVLTFMRDAEF